MLYRLKELGEFKNGANFPRGSYGKGIKIVNVKDLFPSHFINTEGLDELQEDALKNPYQYELRHGDILFTRSSLVQSGTAMCAMIEKPAERLIYCGFIIRFRPNLDMVKAYDLYIHRLGNLTLTKENSKLSKTDFNNHFRENSDVYDSRSEKAIYDIYCGNNERQAFEFAVDVFGKKYPTISYLFFIKDETRFLPISPENFEERFKLLNIDIKLSNKCEWDNYLEYIQIIDCIRELMPLFMKLEHAPTLLEAHSFVWIIGEGFYTAWLKGQELKKVKEEEEQRKLKEREEREKNRVPTKVLSEFTAEELDALGGKLKGHKIINSRNGPATIIDFKTKPQLSMVIRYEKSETEEDDNGITIELQSESVRKNFSLELELVNSILYASESEPSSDDASNALNVNNDAPNDDVNEDNTSSNASDSQDEFADIPDDEGEQAEQAAKISTEKLKSIAEKREVHTPERREVSTPQYRRDPYIAEFAKREANGVCQLCGDYAPFSDKSGKPYLESHHIVWLSEGGSDTIENTVAVCPNCHRRLHVLKDPEDVEFLKSIKQK